ncbi:hypothetical protein GNI_105290 [Gregarina niphandrodes]|uniref:Uncharacterized protein n=1 Tax=Gregarina niphandrodes TaxID=110365 RepID=A0A023B3Z4_GRENI|nr:hypothetical protein GNI_105290 [Gregarina niphandrodes]EZG56138.1 hypothetical protein GNI_105290 [Gregarina niphandrodes]|eukprot:XP_011131311.1 hypothetical protein GNI_105290 [Gregarina niphandrodes]
MIDRDDVWSDLGSNDDKMYMITPPVYAPLPMAFPLPAADELAISPTQSSSMLTCNSQFSKKFPIVYQGLCKGLIDVRTLLASELVIPIKETVEVRRNVLRCKRGVVGAVSDRLRRVLKGRFPDPSIASKLSQKVATTIWEKLERSIQDAEDERTFLQWLLRIDVNTDSDLRMSLSQSDSNDRHTIITHVEGSSHVRRQKGELFSLISIDHLEISIDASIKALFLNTGPLLAMNRDPQMIDYVRTGDNRFAKRLIMY